MRLALELAKMAENIEEVPIGCVIIGSNFEVLGTGFNTTINSNNPCAHAEINAICEAAKKTNNYRLVNTTMYSTIEPCAMCAGAILNSRIQHVVYGAKEPKTGALGSLFDLFDYKTNHKIDVTAGILEKECKFIIQNFFSMKRKLAKSN